MASTDFKNFELAHRKANIVNFGLLPTGDFSWIDTNLGVAGAPYEETPIGTKDGSNVTFSLSSSGFLRSAIFRNQLVLTEEQGDYTLVGSTITFDEAPESDDTILFWGWTA